MKKLAIIGAGDLGHQIAHHAKNDKHFSKNKASKTRATLPNQFPRKLDTWTRITKKFLSESDCWKLVINSPELEKKSRFSKKLANP